MLSSHLPILICMLSLNMHLAELHVLQAYFPCHLVLGCWAGDAIWQMYLVNWTTLVVLGYMSHSLVEMHPKSLHVTGMFLACNMQGFGTFAMHVCMLCAYNMHTTCRDFECFSMHVACDMHTTLYSQYCDMHVSLTCMEVACNMHITCKKFPLGLAVYVCFGLAQLYVAVTPACMSIKQVLGGVALVIVTNLSLFYIASCWGSVMFVD